MNSLGSTLARRKELKRQHWHSISWAIPNGNPHYPLVGIIQNRLDVFCWTLEGRISLQNDEALGDIVGMWEEPRPRVQLDLPCPLKKWRRNCYTITNDLSVEKTVHTERPFDEDLHFYFATEKDAQEWIDAIRNSSR